jgi:hypothetical protein
MVLTPINVLSPFTGYRMHTSLLRKLPETDSLVGVGFAEGGIMSMEIGLGRFGDRRLEKGGPFCTKRWFDGLVRASDASQGTEHGRFGSRVFCATTG